MRDQATFERMRHALNDLYRRKPTSPWTYEEESTLSEITGRPDAEEELTEIIAGRPKLGRFFPTALVSLLSKWNATLDRVRQDEMPTRAREPSISELNMVLTRKKEEAQVFKNRHWSDRWDDPMNFALYKVMRAEIQVLEQRMDKLAL